MNQSVKDILASKRTLSFEVFPPKTDKGVNLLLKHLNILKKYEPDFISVTYGAGGSSQDKSIDILNLVHKEFTWPIVAHYTCVGQNLANIDNFSEILKKMDIYNILALKGDPPQNNPDFDISNNVFKYASELVKYLRRDQNLSIGVAGYPEGHPKSSNKDEDWNNLKYKIDQGADFVMTQLFFDNNDYYEFAEAMANKGVEVPLVPGVLPVPSVESLNRTVNLAGSRIPDKLQLIVDKYSDDSESFFKASVDYAVEQINDLLSNDVPGIHLYILNKSQMPSLVLDQINYK